jgi:hypothetical protein
MKERITIKIDARWGSDLQKSVGLSTLDQMLKGWREALEPRHQGNKISIQTSVEPMK